MGRPVGRSRDLERARTFWDHEPHGVIVGPPGIGKSTFLMMFGEPVAQLGGARSAADVDARLAEALGLPVARAEVVDAALAGRRVLLDDVEDALPWVRPRLPRWRGALLAVRRAGDLDLPRFELSPLDPDAGAALLAARAGASRPLDPEALRALSAHVDGHPLTLCLLAPRLRLHEPERLLQTPVAALVGPSLLEAVRANLEGLDAEGRAVLAVAACVPGALCAEDLAAACGAPVDAGLLAAMDAGLIQAIDGRPPTFRALAPVRAALGELLRPDVDAPLGRLARAWGARVLAAPAGMEGPDGEACAAWVGSRAAVLEAMAASGPREARLACALGLAALDERRGSARRVLERDAELDRDLPGDRAPWVSAVVRAALDLGELDRAKAALAELEGEPSAEASSLVGLVRAAEGDLAASLAAHDRAVAGASDPRVRFRRAVARLRSGDARGALDDVDAALAAIPAGTRALLALRATALRAIAARELGEPSAPSLAAHERALAEAERRGLDAHLSLAGVLLAVLRADVGDLAGADAAWRRAVDVLRAQGLLGDAVFQDLQRRMIGVVHDASLTELEVDPDEVRLAPHQAATVLGWRALLLARSGGASEGLERAVAQLVAIGHPAMAVELGALGAVARGPGRGEGLLERVSGLGVHARLVALARSRVSGRREPAGDRWEERLLVALDRGAPAVRVARDGSWFEVDGRRVDLARKRVLARLLVVFVEAGGPVAQDALVAGGWPGERLVGGSGTRRLQVAISTLRQLGLRDALETVIDATGTRWRLGAEVEVVDGGAGAADP